MFVVAILQLATPIEAEVEPLAADLGVTIYEARLALAAPAPAIVLSTPDRERATYVLRGLRARGHGAVACDSSAVVASSAMTALRRFSIREDALVADDAGTDRLSWADVIVLICARHRVHVDKHTETREKQFSMTRAIVSGGIVVRKEVTHAAHTTLEERERVLYLFRANGAPWILRENEASYAGLPRMAPTVRENFDATVRQIREHTPNAPFDERLLAARAVRQEVRVAGDARAQTLTTSTSAGVDLLAHLLAMWIAKGAA